jgi:hypothetical protein
MDFFEMIQKINKYKFSFENAIPLIFNHIAITLLYQNVIIIDVVYSVV